MLKSQLMGIFMFRPEQPEINPATSCSTKKHLCCWVTVAATGSNKLLNVSKGITGPGCVRWCCSLDYHRFWATKGAQTEHHAHAQDSSWSNDTGQAGHIRRKAAPVTKAMWEEALTGPTIKEVEITFTSQKFLYKKLVQRDLGPQPNRLVLDPL